jgi:hypothetical protein
VIVRDDSGSDTDLAVRGSDGALSDRYTQIVNDAYGAISELLTVLSNDETRYTAVLIKKLRLGLQKVVLESLLQQNNASVEERFKSLRRDLLKDKFRLDTIARAIDSESAALEEETGEIEKALRDGGFAVSLSTQSSLSGDELFKLHATLLRLYPSLPLAKLPPPDDVFSGVVASRVYSCFRCGTRILRSG